jgi:lipopolysaccharide export system protein LptC
MFSCPITIPGKLKQIVQSTEHTLSTLKQKNDELIHSEGKNKDIIEKLKRAVYLERNAFSTAKLKNEEMVRLLKDQKVTIESLVKQNAGTFRSQGMKTSMDDLTAYLSRKRQGTYFTVRKNDLSVDSYAIKLNLVCTHSSVRL